MPIRIHLHPTHRAHAGGLESVDVAGDDVGACLEDLVGRHPDMRDALFEADGALRRNIEIWVNARTAYPEELEKPTRDGDEFHVTVILTGG